MWAATPANQLSEEDGWIRATHAQYLVCLEKKKKMSANGHGKLG